MNGGQLRAILETLKFPSPRIPFPDALTSMSAGTGHHAYHYFIDAMLYDGVLCMSCGLEISPIPSRPPGRQACVRNERYPCARSAVGPEDTTSPEV